MYISPGFSGNSSDWFTIQHSGILDELKPGQRILADKGYNAQDLFALSYFHSNNNFLAHVANIPLQNATRQFLLKFFACLYPMQSQNNIKYSLYDKSFL